MENALILENFIAGNFVESRRWLDSFEPGTGRVFAKVPDSGKLEVEAAVSAAARAFPEWSKLCPSTRADYLLRVADILEEKLNEFAHAESRDQGKPLWLTKLVDIPRAVKNFRHFAHTMPHIMETSKSVTATNTLYYTIRQPVGVAGLISPWNLPLYLLTFKMAPALMAGNTVVAKPSEMTSVTAFLLCKIFEEVGLPAGVVNVVFGLGATVGDALVKHPEVPLLSFTGSTMTGKNIAMTTAPKLKKLSLELGGKNAGIVFSDCDMDSALKSFIRSSFINQGQVCLCTSRIFVQKEIYDVFLQEFVTRTRCLKVGDPDDPESFLGALNSEQHAQKVRKYVALAKQEGGTVLCGESVDQLFLLDKNKTGYFMRPTIITGLPDHSRCMQEEIFGPVTCVTSFETEAEVIKRVNNTEYGLCASVWTSNLGTAHRMANDLNVGTVWTNCWMVRDMDLPFGGTKGSGTGREGTRESFEFFTEVKTVCTNFSG